MGTLDGKGAVVTGGSRGIGRAVVLRLAAEGATVVFGYRREAEAAEAVVRESGGRAHAVQVDLAESGAVARLFAAADDVLDGLDVVVNVAAVASVRPIDEITEEEYDRVMAINTKAVFLAIQEAGRRLRDGGRIINFSTSNTSMAGAGISLYAASKGAVEQLTKVAARELGPRGITVNSVLPGAVDTDMLRSTNTEEGLAFAVGLTALGRLGEPADLAAVVALLAGPDAGWITGQRILANGGLI